MREGDGGGEDLEGPEVLVGWQRRRGGGRVGGGAAAGGAAATTTTSTSTSTSARDDDVPSTARSKDGDLQKLSPPSSSPQVRPAAEAALTKNQKHRLRKKRCRLAKRLMQGDSTDDPFVVADVRTPTAAAAAAVLPSPSPLSPSLERQHKQQLLHQQQPPAVLLSGSGVSTQDVVTMYSCGGLGEGEGKRGGGGDGSSRSDNSGSGRQRGGGRGEEDGEGHHEGPFSRSRHRRFDDDDDGEDEKKENDDSKKRKRDEKEEEDKDDDDDDGGDDDDDDDDDGSDDASGEQRQQGVVPSRATAAAPVAPCRVDLSFAAAAISVSLERFASCSSGQAQQQLERGTNVPPSSSRFASASASASASSPASKAAAAAAPRGNYPRYYGYRLRFQSSLTAAAGTATTAATTATHHVPVPSPLPPKPHLSAAQLALYGPGAADPRLTHLLPYLGLLRGRRLLDVGCNGGHATLAVAAAAGAASALGVDVDGRLVRSAREACRRVRESARAWEKSLRVGKGAFQATVSRETERGGNSSLPHLPEPGGRSLAGKRAAARSCARALMSTTFRREDFVNCGLEMARGEGGEKDKSPAAAASLAGHFGAALCLSVTKWIHLRDGDAGIERLFSRLSRCLSRGGHLVLEPQPWRSYKRAVRKKGVKETLLLSLPSREEERDERNDDDDENRDNDDAPRYRSLSSLKIKPEDFVSLLEEERFGFKLVRSLGAPAGAAPGFDRPLLLFRKK